MCRIIEANIPCRAIKIEIDKETGETSVWNDGDVIDIEINDSKDNKEKLYNHTLVFGNLRTGSNYNDDEERLISAAMEWVGKACLGKGTNVILFNGTIKTAENIKIGDYSIGDDGTKRKVLEVTSGFSELYEIKQKRGDSYIVNSNHVLTVRMPDHKVIFWNSSKQGWSMLYGYMLKNKSTLLKVICIETKYICKNVMQVSW